MIVVYVAGPVRGAAGSNQFQNVRDALVAAKRLRDAGYCVIVPHYSVLAEIACGEDSYEHWIEQDFELIRRSDVLCRLPGESVGSDAEVAFAEGIGRRVVRGVDVLVREARVRASGQVVLVLEGSVGPSGGGGTVSEIE